MRLWRALTFLLALLVPVTAGLAQSRVDQLGAAAALSGSETLPVCQGCSSSTALVRGSLSQLVTYLSSVSQTLTNKTVNCADNVCTVRIGSDVSGLGTGVATALGVNLGSAGAVLISTSAAGGDVSGTLGNLQVNTFNNGTAFGGLASQNTPASSCVIGSDGTSPVARTMGTGLRCDGSTVNFDNVRSPRSGAGAAIASSDANKLVLIGAFTYTLAQAGSAGFEDKWATCLLNIGAGNATVNATTSTFVGWSGTTSLTIRPGDMACPESDGTNYITTPVVNGIGLTANVPLIGGGAGTAPTVGTRSGNTTEFATSSGAKTSNNCVKWDANGNAVDAGAACGGGAASAYLSGGTATLLSASATRYIGAATLSATELNASVVPVSRACTLKAMAVQLTAAAGATASYEFRVRKGTTSAGVLTFADADATNLKCTVGNSATVTNCQASGGNVAMAVGDTVDISAVPTGTPATPSPSWSVQCDPS